MLSIKSILYKIMRALLLNRKDYTIVELINNRRFFLETFPQSYLNQWKTNPCVFLLSTGRTGTMQIAALLDLSKKIIALHEPTPLLYNAGHDAYFNAHDIEKWISVVHAARDELVAFANHRNCIYIETNNRLTFLAEAFAAAYPASKFIFLYRHPYDVIRSGMRRKWYSGNVLDYTRITPKSDDQMAANWNQFCPEEKIAWLWNTVNEYSRLFIEKLPKSRSFELRAEDVFEKRRNTIVELFNFIGAPMPPEKDIVKVLSLKLNAQKKGKALSPVEWSSELKTKIDQILGSTAMLLKYPL